MFLDIDLFFKDGRKSLSFSCSVLDDSDLSLFSACFNVLFSNSLDIESLDHISIGYNDPDLDYVQLWVFPSQLINFSSDLNFVL